MKVEISPRQHSIRVYANDPTNYVASCQVFQYGDRGILYSMYGKNFYKAYLEILTWADQNGIRTLEGYGSRAHYRLLRKILRNTSYKVTADEEGDFDGHRLVWIVVGRK